MPHPAPETPLPLYTAEQLYTLLNDRSNDDERLALATLFDTLPYNYDGIAVYETPLTEGNDENDPGLICFNDQLTAAETAGLRKPGETLVPSDGTAEIALQEHQKNAKQPVRSLPKLLGAVGISGVTGTASGVLVEVLAPEAGAEVDTTIGLLMAGATYLVARPWMKRRQLREAQQSVDALRDRCLDPDEGSITFLRDKVYSYSVGQPGAGASEKALNAALEELWVLPPETAARYAIDCYLDSEEIRRIDFRLGKFVEKVLQNNVTPGEAWHEYLGGQAEELSGQEFSIGSLEEQIARVEHVRAFTGYTDDEELQRLQNEMQTVREDMLSKVCEVILWSEQYAEEWPKRQRIAAAEALIRPGPVITGEGAQPHPYDPQMRPLISIVADSLSRLDLTEQNTIDLANAIAEYLEGTRNRLWMSHMRYFYRGLHTKFSAHLPGLPTWEEAKDQFVWPRSSGRKHV